MPQIKELPTVTDEDGQHTARMQADEVWEIAAITIQALWRSSKARRAVQAWLHLLAEYQMKMRRGVPAEPPVPLAEWHFSGAWSCTPTDSGCCGFAPPLPP